GVPVRDWHYRNFGQGLRILDREALGVSRRTDARRERITWIDGHVHHAAALRAVGGTHRALRKHFAGTVAIVFWIGIDQTPDRTVFCSDLGLDAAPRFAVARHDDRAFH